MGRSRGRRLAAAGGVAGLLTLTLAACGGNGNNSYSSGSSSSSSPTTAAATPASSAGANSSAPLVSSKSTAKGTVLVDASGMTLYRFDHDSGGTIACTGSCTATWPPAIAPSDATTVSAAAGIDGLALVARPDVKGKQITHAGHPLYRFSGDTKAGDTNGDGVGGIWHVELSSSGSGSTTATTAAGGGTPYSP